MVRFRLPKERHAFLSGHAFLSENSMPGLADVGSFKGQMLVLSAQISLPSFPCSPVTVALSSVCFGFSHMTITSVWLSWVSALVVAMTLRQALELTDTF